MRQDRNPEIEEISKRYVRASYKSFLVPHTIEEHVVSNRQDIRRVRYRHNVRKVDVTRDGRVEEYITRLIFHKQPLDYETIYSQIEHHARTPWRARVGVNFTADQDLSMLDVPSARWALEGLIRRVVRDAVKAGVSVPKKMGWYGVLEVGDKKKLLHAHLLLPFVPNRFAVMNYWKDFGSPECEVLPLDTAEMRNTAIGYVVCRELQYSLVDYEHNTNYAEQMTIKRLSKQRPRRNTRDDKRTVND